MEPGPRREPSVGAGQAVSPDAIEIDKDVPETGETLSISSDDEGNNKDEDMEEPEETEEEELSK